ncbi:RPM1-interacting protein 4 [Marchantia polymorpha subsp. ruderalis]|nr:hypothetical protein Mp_1g26110 [Marchantia polymorpha subsp. ruderalis]
MARSTHVPKFGNWDANDHMPYTAVFDHARTGRGKPVNPNDPSENPEMFGGSRTNGAAPGRRIFNPNDPEDMDASDLHQERRGTGNRDSGNSRAQQQQAVAAPPRSGQEPQARRPVAAIPAQGPHAEARSNQMPSRAPPTDHTKRPGNRESVGLDRNMDSASTSFSADQSPSHPTGNQARKTATGMLGGASPAHDSSRGRRSTGEEQAVAPSTPTRQTRLRTGNSKPEDSAQNGAAALPRFGAWNAQDPGSGDGFTVIFNNARNERRAGGPVRIPQPNDNSNDGDLYNQQNMLKTRDPNRRWFCCFSPTVNA